MSTYLGKYLLTNFDVNTDHDWENPFYIVSIHVYVTGMISESCWYCIKSGSDEV